MRQFKKFISIKFLKKHIFDLCKKIILKKYQNYRTKKYIVNLIQEYKIYCGTKKNLWLITEAHGHAKDNGWELFIYIRKNYPDFPIYYVTNQDSPFFDKIKQVGNYFIHGTDAYLKAFFASTVLLSTHSRGTIEPWESQWKPHIKEIFPEYYEKKYIMLQHGVIKANLINHFKKSNIINASFDLLICGAKPEYNFCNNYFEYDSSQIEYTGLARYDRIYKDNIEPKNIILIMPTWRSDICNPSWLTKKKYNDARFLHSKYYKKWISILNNTELFNYLDTHDLKVIFYPHPEVLQYSQYFYSSNNKVIIANNIDYDLQNLIVDAKMLITDFSSVFFDFAYMEKPIIHYHFDHNQYYASHYKKGYYLFEKDALGDVCHDEDSILEALEKIANNDFHMDDKFLIRKKRFFPLYDTNNSKRIFDIAKERFYV